MLVPTHNPVSRVYLLTKGIEYLQECLLGILHATRRIERFAMMLLHRDRKLAKIPSNSKYLIPRVSTYHKSVTTSNLRVRLSLDQSRHGVVQGPVLLRVTVQRTHGHLASGTYSQGPR